MTDGDAIDHARRLMREGLSDEAIETETGLNPLQILDLRAKAAVEEPSQSSKRKPKADPPGS